MKLGVGAYRIQLESGAVAILVGNEAQAAALETWLKQQKPTSIGRVQGGTMGQFSHSARPIAGADGPWWVISRNPDGTDFNVTTGIANASAAMGVCIGDGIAILSAASATAKNIDIFTTF